MKVKFLEDREVQDATAGTRHAAKFKRNKVYTMSEASAHHWISRGSAIEAGKATVEKPDPAPTPEEDADTDSGEGDPAPRPEADPE